MRILIAYDGFSSALVEKFTKEPVAHDLVIVKTCSLSAVHSTLNELGSAIDGVLIGAAPEARQTFENLVLPHAWFNIQACAKSPNPKDLLSESAFDRHWRCAINVCKTRYANSRGGK